MNAPTLTASVVICAYTEERWHDIVAAVDSLRRQTHLPHEIILVVDHNPALLARAQAEFGDAVRVMENSGPRGLSGGRNTGIEVATAPLVAFLDDDATASPDWLARLASHCADANVLGAGSAAEPAWEGARPRWFPPEFYWVVGCSYRGMPERVAPVRNLFGGSMLLRKEVFDGVGGFRDGIGRVGTRPVGGEETELCIRAHQRWPERVLLYDPATHIHHHVPAARARLRYLQSRCYSEGLSKALVVRFVGGHDGLSTERSYTLKTLPQGVWRGVTDAVYRRDVTGLARAGTIIFGLAWTTAGYLVGRLTPRAVVQPLSVEEPDRAR